MKILITRPKDRIQPLQSHLESRGYLCVSHPLFEVLPIDFRPFDIQDYDGVIITSFYASAYLTSYDKEIFVVGDSLNTIFPTSYVFSNIKDLKLALNHEGYYLYLRGEYVTDELLDIYHDSRVVYTTKPADRLPADFDAVLLFSKRTAEIFENLSNNTKDIEVFVLSIEIAKHLKKEYKKVYVAPKPTLEGMLELF